jgi:hypothetical protein
MPNNPFHETRFQPESTFFSSPKLTPEYPTSRMKAERRDMLCPGDYSILTVWS